MAPAVAVAAGSCAVAPGEHSRNKSTTTRKRWANSFVGPFSAPTARPKVNYYYHYHHYYYLLIYFHVP